MRIRGNEAADRATRTALQLDISVDIKLPYTDLKQTISAHFYQLWQQQWNRLPSNKLKKVKSVLRDTVIKNIVHRRDEVVLHCARIGHTFLTHAHLLKHENRPVCGTCQCTLTVEHVLIDCPVYNITRSEYFTITSLAELFVYI